MAYLMWGLYQGLLLVGHRLCTGGMNPSRSKVPPRQSRVFHWIITVGFFHLVCVGWLIFRAGSVPDEATAASVLAAVSRGLATPPFLGGLPDSAAGILALGALGIAFQARHESMDHFSKWSHGAKVAAMVLGVLCISVLGVFEGGQFIYFQF